MKTVLTMVLITFMSCGMLSAQNTQTRQRSRDINTEELMQKRIERMQKSLLLDEKEAEKFAPLYKEYLKNLRTNMPTCPVRERKDLTDEQKEQMRQYRLDCKQKMDEAKKTYYPKFKEFLNDAQLEKLFNNDRRAAASKEKLNRVREKRAAQAGKCDGTRQRVQQSK